VLQDIVLGVVQGLTEFLPISSSGHLVVVPAHFNWEQPSLTFDLLLHLGTLLAVVFAFRRDLWRLLVGLFGGGEDPSTARRAIALLALGSVPAAIAGIALESFFESLFERPGWVVAFWVVTAIVLLVAEDIGDRVARTSGTGRAVDSSRALGIGIAQATAITPGISRSGVTISAGLVGGMTREDATRFSFLLAIPAILGATLVRMSDVTSGEFHLTAAAGAGFLAAAVSGYLSVVWLLRLVRTHSLRPFAVYLFCAAAVSAVILAIR
jgi:undecaprenyl-diphosphatase